MISVTALAVQSLVAVVLHHFASKWIEKKQDTAAEWVATWPQAHAPGDGAIKGNILNEADAACRWIRFGETLAILACCLLINSVV